MKMKLTEFIKSNNNWEELLQAPPYCIKIKRDDGFLIFSYNQIESDFSYQIVRECRGVILEVSTFRPVCVPFYKFGNYGESYAPILDWASAKTQEKIDGSLMKVWFDGKNWRVSTNGNIDANKSPLEKTNLFEDDCPYSTYADLFDTARKNQGLDFDILDKNCTYMFELVSPYNKVVVLYNNLEIYHIGTRNNITLEEIVADIGIQKPKEFPLNSLEMCVNTARTLPTDKEGYVVVDKYFNRVKIKNPAYVALHHLKNNGVPTISNLLGIIRKNEVEEFLTYFPECRSVVKQCKNKIDLIFKEIENEIALLENKQFSTQKDFAQEVKNKKFSSYYFAWMRDKNLTPRSWFWSLPEIRIKRMLSINE